MLTGQVWGEPMARRTMQCQGFYMFLLVGWQAGHEDRAAKLCFRHSTHVRISDRIPANSTTLGLTIYGGHSRFEAIGKIFIVGC